MSPTWAAARHPTPERGHIRPGWARGVPAKRRGRGAKPQRTGGQGKDDPEWSTHPKGRPGHRSRLAEGRPAQSMAGRSPWAPVTHLPRMHLGWG